jgi:hypothetical protein
MSEGDGFEEVYGKTVQLFGIKEQYGKLGNILSSQVRAEIFGLQATKMSL